MAVTFDPVSDAYVDSHVQCKQLTANLNQAAGTYDLGTVSGGLIDIVGIELYNDVAAAGLTSVSMASNDTTPATILASTALAALTGGKNLTPYAGPLVLPSGKKLQYTIVGTGTAGSIQVLVRYIAPLTGVIA